MTVCPSGLKHGHGDTRFGLQQNNPWGHVWISVVLIWCRLQKLITASFVINKDKTKLLVNNRSLTRTGLLLKQSKNNWN